MEERKILGEGDELGNDKGVAEIDEETDIPDSVTASLLCQP